MKTIRMLSTVVYKGLLIVTLAKVRLLLIGCAIVLLAENHIIAQSTYNSPYSVYGIGMLSDRTTSLNRGMGGVGFAVQDPYDLNHANPASYGSILSPMSHIFEIGTYVELNRYETSELSEAKSNGGLTNLSYWFKFKPWWSSVVGLSPLSSVAYNIQSDKEISLSRTASYVYKGSGNISQLYSGNAFTIAKNLSLGVNVSYLFGTISRSESVYTPETSNILTLETKTFTNKLNVDFGAQYKIQLRKRSLVLGAVYDNGLSLRGKRKQILYDENLDTLSNEQQKSTRYRLPQTAGFGVALNSKRSVLAADVKFSDWTSASFANQEVDFVDTWKVAAGYTYRGNENAENYLGLVGIRTGFNVQNHYMYLNGKGSTSWGASFGLSLPVFDGKSCINLVYSYDQMGTLDNNMILQRSQKFMIDIVIRDRWGIRRKFD